MGATPATSGRRRGLWPNLAVLSATLIVAATGCVIPPAPPPTAPAATARPKPSPPTTVRPAPTTTTRPTTTTTTRPATTTTRAVTTTTRAATTTTTASPAGSGSAPNVGGCTVFPASNSWNTDVSTLPVRSGSAAFVTNIGTGNLHPDFGGNGAYGIPIMVVPSTEPLRPINYTAYGDESDPRPFPIPPNAPIEGGAASDGDRHVIVVQQGTCHDFELGRAFWQGDHWDADVGVNWDLSSNALRPLDWTSADAAGLAILPGLVRYDEVASGVVNHAIRFTVPRSQKGYVFPATHDASSSTDATLPPMGLRLRLKASFDLAPFHGESLVILTAMKKYGLVVADNGSPWFFQGAADTRWDDNDLDQMKSVPGSAFEVVDNGPVNH